MATSFTLAAEGKVILSGDFGSLPRDENFTISREQTASPYTKHTVGFGYCPPSSFNGTGFAVEVRLPAGTYTIATDSGAQRLRFTPQSGGDVNPSGFSVL